MTLKPVDSKSDLSLVYLREGTPHCKKHGAMNQLTASGLWRCFSVYNLINFKTDEMIERSCEASCYLEEVDTDGKKI